MSHFVGVVVLLQVVTQNGCLATRSRSNEEHRLSSVYKSLHQELHAKYVLRLHYHRERISQLLHLSLVSFWIQVEVMHWFPALPWLRLNVKEDLKDFHISWYISSELWNLTDRDLDRWIELAKHLVFLDASTITFASILQAILTCPTSLAPLIEDRCCRLVVCTLQWRIIRRRHNYCVTTSFSHQRLVAQVTHLLLELCHLFLFDLFLSLFEALFEPVIELLLRLFVQYGAECPNDGVHEKAVDPETLVLDWVEEQRLLVTPSIIRCLHFSLADEAVSCEVLQIRRIVCFIFREVAQGLAWQHRALPLYTS